MVTLQAMIVSAVECPQIPKVVDFYLILFFFFFFFFFFVLFVCLFYSQLRLPYPFLNHEMSGGRSFRMRDSHKFCFSARFRSWFKITRKHHLETNPIFVIIENNFT